MAKQNIGRRLTQAAISNGQLATLHELQTDLNSADHLFGIVQLGEMIVHTDTGAQLLPIAVEPRDLCAALAAQMRELIAIRQELLIIADDLASMRQSGRITLYLRTQIKRIERLAWDCQS